MKFEDYTNLAQGQITFAVTQNGWPVAEGAQPGLLFLLDTKNQSGQLTKNLADLRKKLVDSGRTVRTEKIRNIEFAVVTISDKDMPKTLRKFSGPDAETDSDESSTNKSKTEIYVGQSESLLIVGTAAKSIEKVLVHATGGEMPALGDLAVYEANRLALFRDSPLYAWANSKTLLDLFTRRKAAEDADTPDPFSMFDPTKILAALGFSNLKSVAFSVQMGNDGSSVQVLASVPASSREGIFAMLPDAKDATPPPFVPASAVKFQRYRVDGKKAWETLQKVLNDVSPQAKAAVSFMIDTANSAAKEKDPDFDMNKNFFGNLGDDMIEAMKRRRIGLTPDEEMKSPPSLFPARFAEPGPGGFGVSIFVAAGESARPFAAPKDTREFLGRKIYTGFPARFAPGAGAPGMEGSDDAPSARSLNYAASSGYVAISTDASMIEEYLRSSDSQQKALRETPGLMTDAIYAKARRAPARAGSVTKTRRETLRASV